MWREVCVYISGRLTEGKVRVFHVIAMTKGGQAVSSQGERSRHSGGLEPSLMSREGPKDEQHPVHLLRRKETIFLENPGP